MSSPWSSVTTPVPMITPAAPATQGRQEGHWWLPSHSLNVIPFYPGGKGMVPASFSEEALRVVCYSCWKECLPAPRLQALSPKSSAALGASERQGGARLMSDFFLNGSFVSQD